MAATFHAKSFKMTATVAAIASLLAACGGGGSESGAASAAHGTQLQGTVSAGTVDLSLNSGAPSSTIVQAPSTTADLTQTSGTTTGDLTQTSGTTTVVPAPTTSADSTQTSTGSTVVQAPATTDSTQVNTGSNVGQLPASTVSKLTEVTLQSLSSANQAAVPVTFALPFAPGSVRSSETISARLADGTSVVLQSDVKTRHADGSLRHAVFSAVMPQLAAGRTQVLQLFKDSAPQLATANAASATDLINKGFNASVEAVINGTTYQAKAEDLLKGATRVWLSGSVATEWLVNAPLKTASGEAHPHLTARFAIRYYPSLNRARVDTTVENTWAYEANPKNFIYDASIKVDGKAVYSKAGFTHLHHSRYRKIGWWGDAPQVNVRMQPGFLIDSRAVPNYDRSVVIPETTLASLKTRWTATVSEPMAVGLANPAMASVGGRPDIGLQPAWNVMWMLSQDERARAAAAGTADLAGSWTMHYRDKNTDRPLTVNDYPYATILGRPTDTLNPATKKYESFPVCPATECKAPHAWDVPHMPGFAYYPYMVTGDYYYLEEMQFWAALPAFSGNPYYREFTKGLVKNDQVRGQAWSLRAYAQAAYLSPDNDPMKAYFTGLVNHNLDWYLANYVNNPSANKLGMIVNGYALGYNSSRGLAPWMDDFFTSAIGHLSELGFTKADPLLAYKAKFPVERMVGVGACWIDGGQYALNVRDSATSAFYTTIAEAYRASHDLTFLGLPCGGTAMATALKLKVGEMTGYSYSEQGYPANMQPALAYAAKAHPEGAKAWAQFQLRTVKPNYGFGPQFAIVPRN